MNKEYKICSKCVMDTTDPDIVFDDEGVCNYCRYYKNHVNGLFEFEGDVSPHLEKFINKVRKDGRGKKYDCIAGASGGVDSTYALYLMKQYGIRPLVVHLDNGWNSELAVKNIENLVTKLGFDLYTKVLNWEEFKNLQVAYLKASVIDLEALTDHAISALCYKVANQNDIKWILAGTNQATEATLPEKWRYADKGDAVNIRSINKKFGGKAIRDYPFMGILKFVYYNRVRGIKWCSFLDYFKYDKEIAKEVIIKELGWRDYGGKHYESIITKFYQGYILPVKFGIDKRRAHLSTLIQSGQLKRSDALEMLSTPPISTDEIPKLKSYVCKKLGLTEPEFDSLMKQSPKSHYDYGTDAKLRKFIFWLNRKIRRNKK